MAAAADPRAEALPPSFPKILSEMSSREAKFLDGLHEHLVETGPKPMTEMAFSMPFRRGELLGLYTGSGEFSVEAFNVDVDSLLRFRLIENEPPHVDRDAILSGEPYLENNVVYRMTSLGSLFVKTCKSK